MKSVIQTHGDPKGAVVGVLKSLLNQGVVKAWLLPLSGSGVTYALVRDEGLLEKASPFAPVMPINLARAVSVVAKKGGAGKIGVLLRPCEQRAFVELVKFHQIDRNSVLVVGMDCLGTYELKDYASSANAALEEAILRQFKAGEATPYQGLNFRKACEVCVHFTPTNDGGYAPELALGLLGMDPYEAIALEGEPDLLKGLGLEEASEPPSRLEVISALREKRTAKRKEAFAETLGKARGIEGLRSYLSTCIRCHNCMVNCPICYCPDCVFRTETFDRTTSQYLAWAERKGAVPMLPDLILFHLTRMNHMATSCVACGMCTSACPMGIDVGTLFSAVGEKVQALFNYVPGRSLEELPPVAEFKEEEFLDLG
jgi:formate dehydrogenase subunit beta